MKEDDFPRDFDFPRDLKIKSHAKSRPVETFLHGGKRISSEICKYKYL